MGEWDDNVWSKTKTPNCTCPWCEGSMWFTRLPKNANTSAFTAPHENLTGMLDGQLSNDSKSRIHLLNGTVMCFFNPYNQTKYSSWVGETIKCDSASGKIISVSMDIQSGSVMLAGCWEKYTPMIYYSPRLVPRLAGGLLPSDLANAYVWDDAPKGKIHSALTRAAICNPYMESDRNIRADAMCFDFKVAKWQVEISPVKSTGRWPIDNVASGIWGSEPIAKTGYSCGRCGNYNEYAAANGPNDTYTCYNCRVVL